jgi:hypothetical protein
MTSIARGRVIRYDGGMVTVIVNPDPQVSDEDALYVWADIPSPAWGTLSAFRQRPRADSGIIAESDWQRATDGAKRDAQRADTPTVYVMRNA